MTTLLVIAKAPVAGLAKTRLTPLYGAVEAARLAAASLLDTLDTLLKTPADHRVVALTGDLAHAERSAEVRRMLRQFTIIEQRGDSFGARLANAHHDAAKCGGGPVIQIGMDTPQVKPELLSLAAAATEPGTATLGPAHDGGWWLLGLSAPDAAAVLADVPMSTPETGRLTAQALLHVGLEVRNVNSLGDVDTPGDALRVSGLCRPDARFPMALAVAALAKGA